MRLLDLHTYKLVEFGDEELSFKRYAILSHRWGEQELLYKDLQTDHDNREVILTSTKVSGFCRVAKEHRFRYLWVDSMCINQDSSAELSEAVNSMYRWYQNAQKCYVYLADVEALIKPPQLSHSETSDRIKSLGTSEWFTRGWTLQELIAPKHVSFYDAAWNHIEDLENIAELVSQITEVPEDVLSHQLFPEHYSIAQRMSWAATRRTKKGEDRAYSLLGLFDINMPINYGEGSTKAFIRLQEELIKQSTDQSIFAWEYPPKVESNFFLDDLLFASSPEYFRCREDRALDLMNHAAGSTWISNVGLQITIHIVEHSNKEAYLILNSPLETNPTRAIALPVVRSADHKYCLPLSPEEGENRMITIDTLEALRNSTRQTITVCRSWKQFLAQSYAPKYRREIKYAWLKLNDCETAGFRIVSVSDHTIWNAKTGIVRLPDDDVDLKFGMCLSDGTETFHLCFGYSTGSRLVWLGAWPGGLDGLQQSVARVGVQWIDNVRNEWCETPVETKMTINHELKLTINARLDEGFHGRFLTITACLS